MSNTASVLGISGQGISFTGGTDYINIGDISANAQTITFWLKTDSATRKIIDLNGSAYIDVSSGTIAAHGFSGTIYVDGVAGSTITSNAWHFVAITTTDTVSASAVALGKTASSCTLYDSQTTSNDTYYWGSAAIYTYGGQGSYTPAANITTCELDLYLSSIAGTVGSPQNYSYQAEIWNDSSGNLGTAPTGTCISNPVAGSTLSAPQWIVFTGLSCQLSSTGVYDIVITRTDHGNDASNFLYMGEVNSDTAFSGKQYFWQANGTAQSSYNEDAAMKIYKQ
jgi:hypothetical protein